jgi:arylformamidase
MKIYDISHTLRAGMAVWPSDDGLRIEQKTSLADGDIANVTAISMSCHVGTHMDAPHHYLRGGKSIETIELERFVGPARVATVRPATSLVSADELDVFLADRPQRLLIRCNEPMELDSFREDFVALSVSAAEHLVSAGVQLVGIDSPSVDPFSAAVLEAHLVLGRAGVVILENLRLQGVPDGRYELIALPLKLAGGDGSPVRAVLRELG